MRIQETLGKTYYSNLFSRQELVLSKRMLVKLLRLAAGNGCSLSLYGSPVRETVIIEGNPQLALDLKIDKDVLLLESDSEKK